MLLALPYKLFQTRSRSAAILWITVVLSVISCKHGSREDKTGNNIPPATQQDISISTGEVFKINPDSLKVKKAVVRTVKAGQPEEIPHKGIKRITAGDPKIIEIDTSRLTVITPGMGQIPNPRVFVLPEPPTYLKVQRLKRLYTIQYGDTLFAPVISKARPSEPIQALPMSNMDNAVCMIQYLDLHHGLRSASVQAVMEDRQGNIWFGCETGGICRYDGKFLNFFGNR